MTSTPEAAPAPRPRRGRPPSGGREAILAAAREVLTERGASRLTTREVAERAKVSEGSLFYHYTDRTGLLTAVIEDGLTNVGAARTGEAEGADLRAVLDGFTRTVEGFLDQSLLVMITAQSDAQLRATLASHLVTNDMGPHRGIRALGARLRRGQEEGIVRRDVDPDSVAVLVYSSCFERVAQRQMISEDYGADLPTREDLVATMCILLAPPAD
jgi:AcrR family transcriptional regulator